MGLRRRPAIAVGPGERLLAWARVRAGSDGVSGAIGGTRNALYLPHRVAWEQVASADWDQEESVLRVVELAPFGQHSPVHRVPLEDADRLLQLVRERVTASIVVQRHVSVSGRQRVRVLGRRAPGTHGEIAWFVEYDDALDPAAPDVDRVVQEALAAARRDLGA